VTDFSGEIVRGYITISATLPWAHMHRNMQATPEANHGWGWPSNNACWTGEAFHQYKISREQTWQNDPAYENVTSEFFYTTQLTFQEGDEMEYRLSLRQCCGNSCGWRVEEAFSYGLDNQTYTGHDTACAHP
jgi:hypothetical protein